MSPGETLIVHLVNELADLTIPDFYDPAFTAKGANVPLYPRQLTSSPLNLHTHGLHVSPKGNSDNVLLEIPAGYTNTYTYRIPADHPEGMYWYHSHRHTLTAQQTYLGLAGLLLIGRADGNIPVVTSRAIPIRSMAIQYNYVFDRKGGRTTLNDVNWPQYVSTRKVPTAKELADGSYEPKLTPIDFWQSKKGTQFFTVWWSGPLAIENHRGQFQFLPTNLQSFKSADGRHDVAADPSLPAHLRDLQFTINGQLEPVLRARPGQTEIWVLANLSDFAYTPITLTETATGKHPRIAIVGPGRQPFSRGPLRGDGRRHDARHPAGEPLRDRRDDAEQGRSRAGDAARKRPRDDLHARASSTRTTARDHPPAVLGKVEVQATAMSYFDGFFASPTQALARVKPAAGVGLTTPFVEGQPLGAPTSFVDLQKIEPAVERKLVVSGGFHNEHASDQDPKAFLYQFADNTFPNVPLLQPRLGSTEQWSFVNYNNDEHPIHIHVNDFQIMELVDPVRRSTVGVQMWGEDNANLPAPLMKVDETVIALGKLTLRSQFTEFTGAYVIHCHRLNHEDNGLMALVNVIPAVSSFAVAATGSPGKDATVRVHDGAGNAADRDGHSIPGLRGVSQRCHG